MWKERFNHLTQFIFHSDWLKASPWVGKELHFAQTNYHLSDDTPVVLKLSDAECIEAMVAVEKAAYGGVVPWDARDILYDMTQNKDAFYIQAFVADEVVGFIGLRRDPKDVHISNIVVNPAYQSLGLGHILLTEAVHCSKQLLRHQLSLEVRVSNLDAQRFYERHHFEKGEIKPQYYLGDREDALVMRLKWSEDDVDQSA